MSATLAELRDLSRRSRRAQRWGFLALIVALLLYPAQVLLGQRWDPTYATIGALVVGALPFVRYAYLAGEERGAFRKVFRRLADEKLEAQLTRTIVPSASGAQPDAVEVSAR